jgi:predicted dehydrogenase
MAKELFLVGTGNYFTELAKDSFAELQKKGIIGQVHGIDTTLHDPSPGIAFQKREPETPLSQLVDSIATQSEPLVILAHPNHLHAREAIELVHNAKSKPKILIEKPYALNATELHDLRIEQGADVRQIGLLEYYLMMKSIPLQVVAGNVKPDSFYFQPGALKNLTDKPIEELVGCIKDIGKPMYIVTECIEGEGNYGKLEHRHKSLVDVRLGGGMIQDLGHHTFTPLMGLAKLIGHIDPDEILDVRVAHAREYVEMAKEKFGVPSEFVGESYVEVELVTDKGIPVHAAWGKYIEKEGTEKGVNQRRIVIVGTRGTVFYDMTNNKVAIQKGDDINNVTPLLQADKSGAKYQSVMRAGIEAINGNNPFTFDPFKIGFDAQELVFEMQARAADEERALYKAGTFHDRIFEQ